ncbi:MAG: hypothetical protein ACLUOF_05415 [Ruminococcus sp.]
MTGGCAVILVKWARTLPQV